MLSPALALVYAGAVGLAFGSFLNVVIHRLPRGRRLGWSRSRCPYCGGALAAWENVPLLSYLLLRARCRRCGAPISARYPLVEAVTGLLFVLCVARFGLTGEALAGMIFCTLLVALAAIDAEHFLLPDAITLPGIAAGLLLQRWLPRTSFLDAVTGALVGAGLLILLINVWYWWRKEEGMGLGDVNMLALVGAFLGWKGVVATVAVAALAGSLTGVVLLAGRRLGLKSKLPFGVFLALGALVALFGGDRLVDAYLALL